MTSAVQRHELTLRPSLMTMETYVSESRSWRAPVPFLDFLVDGNALIESVLGNGSSRRPTRLQPEWEQFSLDQQVARMLGLAEPDYEDGRTAMYVCTCGDLDCFAVAARIGRGASTITWSDWAWKDGFGLTGPIEELGTYTFALSEYQQVFAEAGRRLTVIPDWNPPRQRMLWPWQWGWRLPKEEDPSDMEMMTTRQAVRQIFLETDPAGLGFGGTWFPESEYDTEVDRAIAWLVKGRTAANVAARTVRYLERDWGVNVQPRKQEQLGRGLGSIQISNLSAR